MDELNERLTRAEIRISYNEDMLDKLSDEIIRLNRLVESLTLEIETIKSRNEDEEVRGIEKPPHY